MDKQHTQYPSRYAIGEDAQIQISEAIFSKCTIDAIKFTESKVFYDVKVYPFEDAYFVIKDVDSVLIFDYE